MLRRLTCLWGVLCLYFVLSVVCHAQDPGTFAATASMAVYRAGQQAVRLLDGRVLVAGGNVPGASWAATSSAEIFNPATGTWTATGSMNYARYGHSMVLLPNGKALVVGGASGNICVGAPIGTSAEIFDPSTGVWTLTGNTNQPRFAGSGTVLANGTVLVAGGGNRCGAVFSSAEIFNPVNGTWTPTGSMNAGREYVASVLLPNGKVLTAGGVSPSPFVGQSSAEIFDPTTGVWTSTGSMQNAREFVSEETPVPGLILLSNGKVLAAGQTDSGLPAAEWFDPSTGSWTAVGNMSAVHSAGVWPILLNDGRVLVAGSCSPTPTTQAEIFNPATASWSTTGSLTTPRCSYSATTLVDGRVLFAGGSSDGSNFINTAELFTPAGPNTPTGTSIAVQPVDATTGGTPATLTFATVSQAGTTSLTTSGSGNPPPSGFKLGSPPTYYQLSTTASYSGLITICINYSSVSIGNPSKLRLFHFEGGVWVDVTISNDTVNKVICGRTTSLSPFAIFESVYSAAIQPPLNSDGSSIFNIRRGSLPVKFTLASNGTPTCQLPPATILLTRIMGPVPGPVNPGNYVFPSDNGPNFRVDSCQYVYNVGTASLGQGTYFVQIIISNVAVGGAAFVLQ